MTTEQPRPRISSNQLIARISWLVPVMLFGLSFHQAKVALDLNRTVAEGSPAIATVTRYERSDRKDVTHAELDLEVAMPDGSTFRREKLSLPYSIAHRVEKDTLHVRVLRASGQEVVITSIAATQQSIAWSNAGMSFIAFMIAFSGSFFWNRFLKRNDSSAIPETDVV